MSKFDDRTMKIYDSKNQHEPFGVYMANLSGSFVGYVFYLLFRDPNGNSGSNPTWGEFYQINEGEILKFGRGLYKEIDYDNPDASYAEKLWSLLGKSIFGKSIRVPHITVVNDERTNERGVISHIILDNDKEDLIDMKSLMFYKYDRQTQIKMRSVVVYQDLLDCVKEQIGDNENFREVEEQIVQVLLLDSITNNADRHTKNWALIRDKDTNHYTLGVFDHGSSFLDMISDRPLATTDGSGRQSFWTSTYMKLEPATQTLGIGDGGDKVVKYLVNRYPEVAQRFFESFSKALPEFERDLSDAPSGINSKRIMSNLRFKARYLENVLDRQREGGSEYYD